MRIELVIGDITNQPDLDGVVNAAKQELTGGGGVDGAVHRAAGPELLDACLDVPVLKDTNGIRCPTGHAVVTDAFGMPNKKIIHTVGPVYKDMGSVVSPSYLRVAYINSIVMGVDAGCISIGFPAIGTGIYGYPLEDATIVAVKSVLELAPVNPNLLVRFVCFDESNFLVYNRVLEAAYCDWKKTYEF